MREIRQGHSCPLVPCIVSCLLCNPQLLCQFMYNPWACYLLTPFIRVSAYVRVTLTVRVLSRDHHSPSLPPCQSIRVCQSNSDSTCTIHGSPLSLPNPLVRVSAYVRVTLTVRVLSTDHHSRSLTPLSEYPRIPLVRVSVYVRVTPTVRVLSRDHHSPSLPPLDIT